MRAEILWDNRPLKLIGQIQLNDFYSELKDLTLAYIFITQPEDINDSFHDPDIIFPDEAFSEPWVAPVLATEAWNRNTFQPMA